MLDKVAILSDDAHQQQCQALSSKLSLPIITVLTPDFDFYLFFEDDRLALKNNLQKQFKPISVDFLSGKLKHRYQFGGGRGQLIAKACGVKSNFKPSVLDLTAGLGQDGFVLASLGCAVTLLERSPIVAALLQDGLERANHEAWFKALSLNLSVTDAKLYLQELREDFPDVIYYDPMFPESKKSALVKKEMRMVRELVGDDIDAAEILSLALKKTIKRVVVKRPRLAPTITDQPPNQSYQGKSGRFDVYLTR